MLWLGLIIGFVLGIVACLIYGVFFAPGEESYDEGDDHEHEYVVRGAHKLMSFNTVSGINVGTGSPITEVLYRCDCGEVTTESLAGWWTYEQLSGVAGSGDTVEVEDEVTVVLTPRRVFRVRKVDPPPITTVEPEAVIEPTEAQTNS